MKTIKAWAVFDKEGNVDTNAIAKDMVGAWVRHVYYHFGCRTEEEARQKVKSEQDAGYTVKPITITWEE